MDSYTTRNNFIAATLKQQPKVVSASRLTMKAGCDSSRTSSIQGVFRGIEAQSVDGVVYEPALDEDKLLISRVISDLSQFKAEDEVIVAN